MTEWWPGWYPDPHHPGQLRWWDGRIWTQAVHPLPPQQQPFPPHQPPAADPVPALGQFPAAQPSPAQGRSGWQTAASIGRTLWRLQLLANRIGVAVARFWR